MKKINKNNIIPLELEEYFSSNPKKIWERFKDECQTGYQKVLKEIKDNQGGVCCYCELTFHDEKGIRDDFRVEHFHPKSDDSDSNINWNLIWTNLLGCCTGGSEKYILEGTRFISKQKHRHSDILKGKENWDDEILNPLEIPAFPPLFKVDSNGKMEVLEENCISVGIDILKAQNCLDEKKLNLNAPKLMEWREGVIFKLKEQMPITDDIDIIDEVIEELLTTYLEKDANGNYQDFFSTIRSHFAEDAETYLKENNYNG